MEPFFDFFEGRIRCGSASGDANGVIATEPVLVKVRRGLDMMNASAVATAGFHQLVGVVAVRAANDNYDVGSLRQFDRGVLSLFGRLADGVDETDF